MRHRPHVQRDHQRRRPIGRRQGGAKGVSGLTQDREGLLASGIEVWKGGTVDTGLEHRGVVGRLAAGEGEVGATQRLEGAEEVGAAIVPCAHQGLGEASEAAQGNFRQQRLGVPEVAIRRAWTDACEARSLCDRETRGTFLGDQRGGGFHQRLPKVAVVVASTFEGALAGPAHVTEFYIGRDVDPDGFAAAQMRHGE